MDGIDAAGGGPGSRRAGKRLARRWGGRRRALDGSEHRAEQVVQVAQRALPIAFALRGLRQAGGIACRVPQLMRDGRLLPAEQGRGEEQASEKTQCSRHAHER